jgi:Protein of unknown function (DUF1549)/Protein of unknown function (DUF1553)
MSSKWILRFLVTAACSLPIAVMAQTETTKVEAKAEKSKKAVAAYDYNIPQVRFINEQISQVWKDSNISPSPPCSDGEWCRRVHLDIIGRIPSVVELHEFIASKDVDKKLKLVDKLLNEDKYIEEYARNWTTLWTTILIGRNGGNEDNSLISRAGMQKYLRDSFARNKPYDKMVYELVTATGGTSPGSGNFNGASNFLVMKLDEGAAQATAMTAKIFLGLQVQCTQCHNHPFNDWKQQKFWEMNAFFKQTKAMRKFVAGTRDVESAELTNQDYADETGNAEEAAVFYELRNAETQVAYPVFVDGTPISKSGFLSDNDRRTELGKLMMSSNYMDITIANRMWQHFLGYGFTKPIDDLGPHNQPTHPELLTYLGQEVRKNSFNLHELMKWITLSEPYGLSSRMNENNKADDPLLGETPKFSHFYLRSMRAEELYESLITATQADQAKGSYEEREKAKGDWLRQFIIAFGTDEGDETTTFNGTIPQVLTMFNGELVRQATSPDKGSFLWNIAHDSKMRDAQKIDYLFMSGLARKPFPNEVTIANKLLVARKGDVPAAMQDIWWAVLNSNEFILNH